jgi:hypothetical protein
VPSFLSFIEVKPDRPRKTPLIAVLSARTQTTLGMIRWYGAWRTFVFEPEPNTIWSDGCMTEIQTRIRELLAAR